MKRANVMLAALVLALGALSLASKPASAGDDGSVALSSEQVVIGGDEALSVKGSGFASCAGQNVVLSLLFRSTTDSGYGPFEDAARYSEVSAPVDATGSFTASLDAPAEFPGWLGYLAMQGDCVTLAPLRLLARLQAVVPLESQLARSLGLPQAASAVVVPAAEVRALPILPDDPAKDPYVKLGEIGLNVSSGATCASAGASRARTASGDIVIDASRCEESPVAVSVSGGTVLQSRATLREGYAVPISLTFPPPGTGTAEAPLPPVVARPAWPQAPDDRWPCVSQVDFNALQLDSKLILSPSVAVAPQIIPAGDPSARPGPVDAVRIAWDLPAANQIKCIWVGVQLPETSNFMAQYILRPGEAKSMTALDVQPSGNVGTYCFRLVAMTSSARGEFADRCADIKNPRMARGPEDAPHPPDTGSGTQTTVGRAVTAGGIGIAAAGAGLVLLSLIGRRKRSD